MPFTSFEQKTSIGLSDVFAVKYRLPSPAIEPQLLPRPILMLSFNRTGSVHPWAVLSTIQTSTWPLVKCMSCCLMGRSEENLASVRRQNRI